MLASSLHKSKKPRRMSHLQKNQKYVTASQSVITQIAPNEQEDAHLAKGLEPAAVVPTQPEWNCSTCTFTNVANRTSCEMCNTNCSGVGALFTKLLQLQDSCSIMPSSSPIECPICLGDVPSDNAVVLASCLHSFCRECLTQSVQRNQRADVICPYMDATFSCAAALLDKEIRALLDEADYTAHLQRSVNEVEVMATDSFHCRTPNCNFWLLVDGYRKANNEAYDPKKDAPLVVNCPVCKSSNCLRCDVRNYIVIG